MIKKITIGFFLFNSTFLVTAQEYPKRDVDLEILADQLFGFQDEDLNYQDLYENMAQLLSSQINLNKASAEELRFLNILSEQQVQNLIQYRQENGDLLSVYELQVVPDFDLEIIRKIIPFVTIDIRSTKGSLWKRIKEEKNNYLIIRYDRTLETKKGFKEVASDQTRFRGNEDEVYMRFRSSKPGDFSFGFTVEKDAGEEINWSSEQNQYGFDFYSIHAQTLNKGKLKNLIIGDYQTQFGQGLLLGGSFGYGKGSETIMTVRRSNLGFLPYTSVNETGYKRGIAFTYELQPHLFLSTFYSNAHRDASLTNDSIEKASISSFQTTGFHRNENELRSRQQIREQNYGVVLNFQKNKFDAGLIFNAIEFNIPVTRAPQPYNQFSFSGSSLNNVGAFLNYTFYNLTFFGEAAHTISNGNGITAGILSSLTPKLDIAISFRHYQRNFQSLYSNAFAESSQPQNETGIYWGWKYRLTRKYNASGYIDLFTFPWLRFRSYAPSEGHEWLLRFNYQPSKNVLIYLQAREESKVRNISPEQSTNLYPVAVGIKRNYWINFDYGLSQRIKLKTRAQFSTYTIGGELTKGMALIQDISVDFGKLTLIGRYALFDTDDFDNRQYAYERDVWLAYSLPAYSGVGIRNYIMAEYTLNKHLSFWIRLGTSRYNDRTEIGSGADTITGDTKRDVRIQARIKF
jgi:hypothetical protein